MGELEPYTQEFTFGEESPYPGLQVKLNLNASLDMWFESFATTGGRLQKLLTEFGDDALVDWNLTVKGEAVPATAEGLRRAPFHLVRFLINEWREAAVNPPLPLSLRQPSGATSEAASEETAA